MGGGSGPVPPPPPAPTAAAAQIDAGPLYHQPQQPHQQQLHHDPTATWWWREASGAVGDLGTFLPLTVALAAPPLSMDLGTTLLFSGLCHLLSGWFTRIPVAVQPMKTIAAVALAGHELRSPSEVAAAGLCVGAVMLLAGATGAMDALAAACPLSIVRGIQLGVGLQLAQRGIAMALLLPAAGSGGGGGWRAWLGVEGLLLGLLATGFLLVTTLPPLEPAAAAAAAGAADDDAGAGDKREHVAAAAAAAREQACRQDPEEEDEEQQQQQQLLPGAASSAANGATPCGGCSSRVPSALLVVLLGLLLSVAAHPAVLAELQLGPSPLRVHLPSTQELQAGAKAALAQLPLTALNSVVALSQLARELFPQRAAADGWRWRPGVVACGVGAMNLVGCCFLAVPCCSGAGGLAAQVKFGARHGAAPAMLGGAKVLLWLLLGGSMLPLLRNFPQPLLGAMLLAAGLELAASARQEAAHRRGFAFTLLTAGAILGLRSTAAGFAVGCACCALAAVVEAVSRWGWWSWGCRRPDAAAGRRHGQGGMLPL